MKYFRKSTVFIPVRFDLRRVFLLPKIEETGFRNSQRIGQIVKNL